MNMTIEQLQAEHERLCQLVAHMQQECNEARAAQKKAETERQQMEDLLMQAPAAIAVMCGSEHRYTLSNKLNCELIGRDDVIGKTVLELVPTAEEQGFKALLDGVYTTGEPFIGKEMPIVLDRPEQNRTETRWADFIYQPIRNTNGVVNGILIHAIDVTDKMQTRRELETRNAENEQLNTELKSRLEELHQAEVERAALQQQIIEAQRQSLRELSTPLIPITDNIVIMPLIGTIDSGRAQQIMDALLEGVAQHRADLAILDITGVSVVDTQVAQALVHAAQAVRLLGAHVMLTGIGPQIAQTLVHLGVDLSSIQTQGNLQTGIALAFKEQEKNHPSALEHHRRKKLNPWEQGKQQPERV